MKTPSLPTRSFRVAFFLIAIYSLAQVSSLPKPPDTPKRPATDEYHGVKVVDDYRWLEKWDYPAVKQWSAAQNARTRAYYAETLPNPKLRLFPIEEVAGIGRKQGIPLIMDNTAAPLLVRPFDHGAAVVVYSTTKYLGGHGTSIGGAIIDGGNFDWSAWPERQPLLNTPDHSYHGAIWSEAVKPLGPIAYIIRARVVLLRDLGAALSPFNAFQIIQGIETLPLRIARHSENALAVVKFLGERKDVVKVIHPSLATGEGPIMEFRRWADHSYAAPAPVVGRA